MIEVHCATFTTSVLLFYTYFIHIPKSILQHSNMISTKPAHCLTDVQRFWAVYWGLIPEVSFYQAQSWAFLMRARQFVQINPEAGSISMFSVHANWKFSACFQAAASSLTRAFKQITSLCQTFSSKYIPTLYLLGRHTHVQKPANHFLHPSTAAKCWHVLPILLLNWADLVVNRESLEHSADDI